MSNLFVNIFNTFYLHTKVYLILFGNIVIFNSMKRTFKSLAVLALSALAMVSCQKELLGPATQEGQEVAVSLDLTTPLMGTKSYADGKDAAIAAALAFSSSSIGILPPIIANANSAWCRPNSTPAGNTRSVP